MLIHLSLRSWESFKLLIVSPLFRYNLALVADTIPRYNILTTPPIPLLLLILLLHPPSVFLLDPRLVLLRLLLESRLPHLQEKLSLFQYLPQLPEKLSFLNTCSFWLRIACFASRLSWYCWILISSILSFSANSGKQEANSWVNNNMNIVESCLFSDIEKERDHIVITPEATPSVVAAALCTSPCTAESVVVQIWRIQLQFFPCWQDSHLFSLREVDLSRLLVLIMSPLMS